MIIDTNNYSAQELSMFFDELSKRLKTKKQYYLSNNISRKGVDKRLKSKTSPQFYNLCGIVLIEDIVSEPVVEEKFTLTKFKLPF